MRNRLKVIFFIFIISPSLFIATGQKLVNSPYARFNLGILEPSGSFRSLGMGGVGTAMRDNSTLYYTNPASYSSIDTNSFVFDFGVDYGLNILSDGSNRHISDDINFDHLLVGFPVGKGWGVGAGITTYSNGYYSISEKIDKNDAGYDPVTGEYLETHTGKGGITRFFAGSGIRLFKYFSLGVNMNLLFGSVQRINQFDFIDYFNSYNNNMSERLELSGISLDYGLQAELPLKNNYFLNAGVSMGSGRNYKSSFHTISYRYNYYGATDTITWMADSSKIFIPGTIHTGVSFGKKNKYTAAFDYVMTNWSESTLHGSAGYLADTRALHFGFEYIPEKFSNVSFLKRVEYRIGGHLEDNYLVINGEQVKEAGISLGLGIPMRRTFSKANVFIDYTKRSGAGEFMHTENFFTLGVSLNLYDPYWFRKHRYD